MVPRSKQNVTFEGQGYTTTAIVWNDTANSSHGTFYSASVQVFSSNFIAKNISFMVYILIIIFNILNHIFNIIIFLVQPK